MMMPYFFPSQNLILPSCKATYIAVSVIIIRRSRSTHANNHKIFTVSYFEREFLGALLGHFIYILSLTMQHERLDHIRHSKADIFVTIFFEVYIFMLVHIMRQHEQR